MDNKSGNLLSSGTELASIQKMMILNDPTTPCDYDQRGSATHDNQDSAYTLP
jgi:hypothetical protein